jgi:hypothetical protein
MSQPGGGRKAERSGRYHHGVRTARPIPRLLGGLVFVAAATGCGRRINPEPPPRGSPAVPSPSVAAYVPGLGELMTFNQMRHAKLWLAGEARNWPLAAYELDELREGFDDVVRYHPTHKDVPLPIAELVPKMVKEPLEEVGNAIRDRDPAAFARSFDALTDACNRCHEAANFGFNVVKRPATNPFPNQSFAPERP